MGYGFVAGDRYGATFQCGRFNVEIHGERLGSLTNSFGVGTNDTKQGTVFL